MAFFLLELRERTRHGRLSPRKMLPLAVIADPFFIARRKQLVALAAGHAMPAIYPIAYFAECGGLMSYGPAAGSLYQQAGTYTERILKGAKPVDVPIEQNTKQIRVGDQPQNRQGS